MSTTIRLDVVALTEDLPQYKVYRGQVGTVVEPLAPGVFEIEFSDDEAHLRFAGPTRRPVTDPCRIP